MTHSFPTRRLYDLAGFLPRCTARPDRVRRGEDRRGEQLRDNRAVAADGQSRRGDHDRRPEGRGGRQGLGRGVEGGARRERGDRGTRSEEHTSELQSLMRISYAVSCLKKKKN